MRWIQQPAMYAWQAALLLRGGERRPRVEKALRDTFLFWAKFDDIDVPPLLRRTDLQVFEEAFRRQLQYKPQNKQGANAAALEAMRYTAWHLGWESF